MPRYDSLSTFRLDFWESDAFDDDYMATLCWSYDGNLNAGNACAPVPKYWLHEGGFSGYIGPDYLYAITVTFTPYSLP